MIYRAHGLYTLVGPPVRGLVLDPLVAFTSTTVYISQAQAYRQLVYSPAVCEVSSAEIRVPDTLHPLRDPKLIEKNTHPPSFWILLTHI